MVHEFVAGYNVHFTFLKVLTAFFKIIVQLQLSAFSPHTSTSPQPNPPPPALPTTFTLNWHLDNAILTLFRSQ